MLRSKSFGFCAHPPAPRKVLQLFRDLQGRPHHLLGEQQGQEGGGWAFGFWSFSASANPLCKPNMPGSRLTAQIDAGLRQIHPHSLWWPPDLRRRSGREGEVMGHKFPTEWAQAGCRASGGVKGGRCGTSRAHLSSMKLHCNKKPHHSGPLEDSGFENLQNCLPLGAG